jgi:hypothetical protein
VIFYPNNRISELYNARDKARAKTMVLGIVFTIVGCLIGAYIGKKMKRAGNNATDSIIKEHAEYSPIHREMVKSTSK